MQLQQIPLLYFLFDVPFVNPIHLSTVVVAAAFAVGLIARKPSVDMVLVVLFSLAVGGGVFLANDHEAALELLESLRG